MKVPFNYLPMQFKNTKEIFKNWKKLIKSSDFTLGQKMIEFETLLHDRFNTEEKLLFSKEEEEHTFNKFRNFTFFTKLFFAGIFRLESIQNV